MILVENDDLGLRYWTQGHTALRCRMGQLDLEALSVFDRGIVDDRDAYRFARFAVRERRDPKPALIIDALFGCSGLVSTSKE